MIQGGLDEQKLERIQNVKTETCNEKRLDYKSHVKFDYKHAFLRVFSVMGC